jgi:hypothetical protein
MAGLSRPAVVDRAMREGKDAVAMKVSVPKMAVVGQPLARRAEFNTAAE